MSEKRPAETSTEEPDSKKQNILEMCKKLEEITDDLQSATDYDEDNPPKCLVGYDEDDSQTVTDYDEDNPPKCLIDYDEDNPLRNEPGLYLNQSKITNYNKDNHSHVAKNESMSGTNHFSNELRFQNVKTEHEIKKMRNSSSKDVHLLRFLLKKRANGDITESQKIKLEELQK